MRSIETADQITSQVRANSLKLN